MMTREEKISAILEASKVHSVRMIDVPGKGAGIKALKDGKQVTEKKLEAMFQRVQELSQESQGEKEVTQATEQEVIQEAEKQGETSQGENKIMIQLTQTIDKQNEQIKALQEGFSQVLSALNTIAKQDHVTQIKAELTQIKDKLESFGNAALNKPSLSTVTQVSRQTKDKKEQVLGFRICQKSTVSKGKKYLKWYASRRIEGKQVWVYLGENASQAEAKISTWLANHPGNG